MDIYNSDTIYFSIAQIDEGYIYWIGIEKKDPNLNISLTELKKAYKTVISYLENNPSKIFGGAFETLEKKNLYTKFLKKHKYHINNIYLKGTYIIVFSKEELPDISTELQYLFN